MEEQSKDALTAILQRLRLRADVYVHADFCGTWAVDTSGHRKVPFHLIGQGSGWLHTDGTGEPRLLSAGDLVMFPHDARHVISSGASLPPVSLINQPIDLDAEGPITSMLCGYFEFQSKVAWPLLDGLPDAIVLDLQEAGRLMGTQALIQLIISELENASPAADAAVNQLACVLFIHLLRAEMQSGLDHGLLCALTDSKIGRALNLIHTEPAAYWTLEDLAKKIGMSRSAFAERFKQLVGITPMRYVTEWRMQEAADLLKTTELSIAAIAEQCGYTSEVAFRKAFRSVIGVPPGQFRRMGRS